MNVTASAYNSTRAQTDAAPNEGAWGDEITPGMKVIAVSPDLIAAGLNRVVCQNSAEDSPHVESESQPRLSGL